MKVMLVLAAGAVLSAAAPVAAQRAPAAAFPRPAEAPAWLTLRPTDPRVAPPRAAPTAPADDHLGEARRLSAPAVMMIAAVVGCAAGAVLMKGDPEDGDKNALRFNGCILGASAGAFLGGAYALLTGR
ncbi:MAG TPA: hypothetical protein VEQ60_26795 [Longimicrobium sp.]|nr:hypothetical protein [Longimicrobium sp.]